MSLSGNMDKTMYMIEHLRNTTLIAPLSVDTCEQKSDENRTKSESSERLLRSSFLEGIKRRSSRDSYRSLSDKKSRTTDKSDKEQLSQDSRDNRTDNKTHLHDDRSQSKYSPKSSEAVNREPSSSFNQEMYPVAVMKTARGMDTTTGNKLLQPATNTTKNSLNSVSKGSASKENRSVESTMKEGSAMVSERCTSIGSSSTTSEALSRQKNQNGNVGSYAHFKNKDGNGKSSARSSEPESHHHRTENQENIYSAPQKITPAIENPESVDVLELENITSDAKRYNVKSKGAGNKLIIKKVHTFEHQLSPKEDYGSATKINDVAAGTKGTADEHLSNTVATGEVVNEYEIMRELRDLKDLIKKQARENNKMAEMHQQSLDAIHKLLCLIGQKKDDIIGQKDDLIGQKDDIIGQNISILCSLINSKQENLLTLPGTLLYDNQNNNSKTCHASFNPTVTAAFNPTTIASFNQTATAAFNPSAIAAINPTANTAFSSTATAAFNPTATAAFNPSAIAAINPPAIATFNSTGNTSPVAHPTAFSVSSSAIGPVQGQYTTASNGSPSLTSNAYATPICNYSNSLTYVPVPTLASSNGPNASFTVPITTSHPVALPPVYNPTVPTQYNFDISRNLFFVENFK